MKKIVAILVLFLGLVVYAPSQSEAAHEYLCNIPSAKCYVDTDTIKKWDRWVMYADVITVNYYGQQYRNRYEITVMNRDGRCYWAFRCKQFGHDLHRISYKNASGYLRDYLVNKYGFAPEDRNGNPLNPVD